MTLLWFSLLGLAALTLQALFVKLLNRWPAAGAVAIAINVLIAWEIPYPPALANVAGSSIYLLDVLCAAFLVIVLSRMAWFVTKFGFAAWAWIGLGILLMVSLIRGVSENEFGTTLNEFRSYVHLYVAMTWAITLPWSTDQNRDLVKKLGLWLGWGLVLVAGYHIARMGFGSTSTFVDAGTGLEQTTRPLVSGQALVLLLCALVCFWYWRADSRRLLLFSGVSFLLVVIVSQQRTVWGVGLAVTAVVFLSGRGRTRVTILVFGALIAWAGAVIMLSSTAPDLLTQLSGAASDSGTYDARIRSWTNLIKQSFDSGFGTVVFGSPMGEGFGRFEGPGRWVTFAPHNWYLTVYLRVGALGLGLLLAFIAAICVKLIRGETRIISMAMLSAIAVYGWSYSWPWYVSVFLGWAIVVGYSRREHGWRDENITSGPIPKQRGRILERDAR